MSTARRTLCPSAIVASVYAWQHQVYCFSEAQPSLSHYLSDALSLLLCLSLLSLLCRGRLPALLT